MSEAPLVPTVIDDMGHINAPEPRALTNAGFHGWTCPVSVDSLSS
jgi:hypothetical protein